MDNQRTYRRLVRKVDGVFTVLHEDTEIYPDDGSAMQLSVTAKGSALTVALDGTQWVSLSDSALPTGGVGLYVWGSDGAWFDDVRVIEAP